MQKEADLQFVIATQHFGRLKKWTKRLDLEESQITGFDPETLFPEGKYDDPKLPALEKAQITAGHFAQLREKSPGVYGNSDLIVVSTDVVTHQDGKRGKVALHKMDRIRNRENLNPEFSPEEYDHLFQLYCCGSFEICWEMCLGICKVRDDRAEPQPVVTEPILISAKIPRLSHREVKAYSSTVASAGVGFMEYVKDQGIQLHAQVESGRKRHKISHKEAGVLVVDKTVQNRKMFDKIQGQEKGRVELAKIPEANLELDYRLTYMNHFLNWWLGS